MSQVTALQRLAQLALEAVTPPTPELYDTIAEALARDVPAAARHARHMAALLRESERQQLRFQGLLNEAPPEPPQSSDGGGDGDGGDGGGWPPGATDYSGPT